MEIDLDYSLFIDATQNLWITFYNQGVSYPAAACANTGDATSLEKLMDTLPGLIDKIKEYLPGKHEEKEE